MTEYQCVCVCVCVCVSSCTLFYMGNIIFSASEINPRVHYSLQTGGSLLRVVKNSCLEKLTFF